MERQDLLERLDRLLLKEPRYKIESYLFVIDALEYTMRKMGRVGHVNGKQLLAGIRDLAMNRFGPMARLVFDSWGVKTTDDFGEIVFRLVDEGILAKTPEDSKDDFKSVYDFKEVFEDTYDWNPGQWSCC
ncbi:MAG: Minf_1886 family protein [bacterium]